MSFKILIVDDSKSTREYLASAVEQVDGAEVFESASGIEALKLLPRHRFDLIITDINMPDVNGLELIHFIRQTDAHKATPLFIVSTEAAETDVKRGLALGAAEYVTKPFDPDALAGLVRRYLGA